MISKEPQKKGKISMTSTPCCSRKNDHNDTYYTEYHNPRTRRRNSEKTKSTAANCDNERINRHNGIQTPKSSATKRRQKARGISTAQSSGEVRKKNHLSRRRDNPDKGISSPARHGKGKHHAKWSNDDSDDDMSSNENRKSHQRRTKKSVFSDRCSATSYLSDSDDDQRKLTKRRLSSRFLKPDKYNGESSLETFLCGFENCAQYNRWDEEDKVAMLRWALCGNAAQLLWGTEKDSYGQLIEKLKNRFGASGLEVRYRTELRCRRRQLGESLRELAQDIRRLMVLAYPGEQTTDRYRCFPYKPQ